MKKVLIIPLVAAIGGGWWWLISQEPQGAPSSERTLSSAGQTVSSPPLAKNGSSEEQGASTDQATSSIINNSASEKSIEVEEQVKPAADAYASADDALAAVIKGSKDFDDSILEQFTEPGEDCSWCGQFYSSVRDLVTNINTPQDQKSYLAEILAISGRLDNVQTLAESIKNASSPTEADIYAEALELTLGKDDVTRYLGDQMSATNDTLREAAVSAVTNQGTRLAAEMLMKHVQERGDADAYYSQGTGPGEFVPDEEALPLVQEYVQRRDAYSPGWAKSLLNAGLPGLRILFEQLENSNNPESDKAITKDAMDHVNFEDGIKELTDSVIASSRNPEALALARNIQEGLIQPADSEEGVTQP